MVLMRTGVWTKTVTFKVDMEQWGVRESVHAVELFILMGSVTETQRGFHNELN
jgi:hypothetical protein